MEKTYTRKHQILDTSAKLFREKGYEATTMRDIATEMDMEAASLYHHIKSKEQILEEICFTMADKLIISIKDVNDIYFNAAERLQSVIKNHIEILTGHPDYSIVFLHEWRSLQEPRLAEFKALRDKYENELKAIIADGINEDIFEDVDQKFASLSILSTLNWVPEWYRANGGMSPAQIAIKLGEFIMGGLSKKLVTDLNYKP